MPTGMPVSFVTLMLEFILTTWLSGRRSRSFQIVFSLGLLLVIGGYFASLFSPRQPETVALDIGISGMRFSLTLLSLFWVQDMFGKEIERKTSTLFLTYPISRAHYVVGRFLGITLLLFTAAVIFAFLLWISAFTASSNYIQAHQGSLGMPFWITMLGIWLDCVVICAFAFCIACLSTMPTLPLLLGALFFVISHTLGAVVQFLGEGAYGQKELIDNFGATIHFAQLIVPDLSRLDWRSWTMYGTPPDVTAIPLSILMAISYIFLMLLLALKIFDTREFD